MIQNLGVVQGSKCAPLYFDIYSNEFFHLCSNDDLILYADDTCLIFTSNDITFLTQHVNNKLRLILEWCNYNKLCLNPSKSEFSKISNRPNVTDPTLFLNSQPLIQSRTFKYLGIHIDNTLKFYTQVEHIQTKLYQLSGITFRLKKHLNLSTAKNVYFSCVYSTLTYCLAVWGGVSLCTRRCNRINTLLHATVVKNIFGVYCILWCWKMCV